METDDNLDQLRGEVLIKPFDRNGNALTDPFQIFSSPEVNRTAARVAEFERSGYIPLDDNLVVNGGRQILAYLIGGRDYNDTTPNNSWIVTHASWGVGGEVPRFTDTTLSPQPSTASTGGDNEILYDGTNRKKPISGVDWPIPFLVRFESILGADEGVGYIIREYGLWTTNGTLFARKVFPAIVKTDTYGISFLHRIRT